MKSPQYHPRLPTSECNIEVNVQATYPPDMPPAEQVLHILGQHGMVWCGASIPHQTIPCCYGALGGKEADFSASNSAWCWSDCWLWCFAA